MKHSLCLIAGLAFSTLTACGEKPAGPPAPATTSQTLVARSAETPAAAQPSSPAIQPSPGGTNAPAAKTAPISNPAADPANARDGRRRYQGGTDVKLDTPYDLSKVKLSETPAPDDDHDHASHDHAGPDHASHDHGNEAVTVPLQQDGRSLLPAAQAQNNKGRFELVDGAGQVKDLGKLRQGEMASYDFPFVAAGEEALVITGVKPSCGCTKSEIALLADDGTRKPYTKGEPIPVGQKFLLESEISTDGKPGGPFNAQITLYGNDIRGPFNVRLTAEIEPVLTITPGQSVSFGRMTTADRSEQTVSVTSTRGEPFRLNLGQQEVQGPVELEFTAKEPDAEGKSNEWQIKVALGPNAEVGMRNYPIQFKSDLLVAHPKYPSQDGAPQTHGFMLNVQAQVTGMVSAEPSFLTFGMVRPGEPVERALRILCHDDFKLQADTPVVVEGLQGQEFPYKDSFAVTLQPDASGKSADLKVRLAGLPADLNGSFGGMLRVRVGHPHMEELQVRFSGVCRPGLPVASAQPVVLGTGQPAQPAQPAGQPK
jgi:hypothetical protein